LYDTAAGEELGYASVWHALAGRAVTVSAGIAEGTADEDGLRAPMKAPDEALYEAKRAGRNRIVVAAQEWIDR
jgi:PleD family two-component response regulator